MSKNKEFLEKAFASGNMELDDDELDVVAGGLEESSLKKGDVVVVNSTATYYDGRIMPSWVKREQWIVKQIDGDRVVVEQNVNGTDAIEISVMSKNINKI